GISGCGPTSLAMIISRLTNNLTYPNEIAKKASNFMNDGGMDWAFIEHIAKEYKIKVEDVSLDKEKMIKALNNGPLLISVGRGYFTLYGHILVIDSYKDGKFIINDPNSVRNSIIEWDFEDISDQILKIWKFSK
uniref:C39 family peptidase n=1 Tax=uncultured Anaerococcus sp. TaxID=293428 RepID=UPI00288ADD2A